MSSTDVSMSALVEKDEKGRRRKKKKKKGKKGKTLEEGRGV